ncbi:hypothetical protein OSTOST_25049, partial [Ostertagia ostertagi]
KVVPITEAKSEAVIGFNGSRQRISKTTRNRVDCDAYLVNGRVYYEPNITIRIISCVYPDPSLLLMHLFPWTILKYLIMPIYYHQRKRMDRIHAKAKHQLIARSPAKA